jgi:hypothetical protein
MEILAEHNVIYPPELPTCELPHIRLHFQNVRIPLCWNVNEKDTDHQNTHYEIMIYSATCFDATLLHTYTLKHCHRKSLYDLCQYDFTNQLPTPANYKI